MPYYASYIVAPNHNDESDDNMPELCTYDSTPESELSSSDDEILESPPK